VRLNLLVERALRSAPPAEAELIRKALREGRIAEVLSKLIKLAEDGGQLSIYYVQEDRFEAAEEREEVVGDVEEAVEEDGLEPVGEVEEVVEDSEYLGQHVVRRALPEPRGEAPRKEAPLLTLPLNRRASPSTVSRYPAAVLFRRGYVDLREVADGEEVGAELVGNLAYAHFEGYKW
jgi:hypothetical protein